MRSIAISTLVTMAIGLSAATVGATPPAGNDVPFEIEVVDVHGSGCTAGDVSIVSRLPGRYELQAEFQKDPNRPNAFLAEASASRTTDFQNCTIDFNLKMKPGYKLEAAAFNADGIYSLSPLGTTNLAIRFDVPGVGTPQWVQRTASYRSDPSNGTLPLSGAIQVDDPDVNYCGATIPFQIQIHGSASRGFGDQVPTSLQVTNGSTRGTQSVGCVVTPTPCHP
jgi:hypothetical protein